MTQISTIYNVMCSLRNWCMPCHDSSTSLDTFKGRQKWKLVNSVTQESRSNTKRFRGVKCKHIRSNWFHTTFAQRARFFERRLLSCLPLSWLVLSPDTQLRPPAMRCPAKEPFTCVSSWKMLQTYRPLKSLNAPMLTLYFFFASQDIPSAFCLISAVC